MINLETENVRKVTATVGIDPRFENSIHDQTSAQKYGFKGALVPGPAVASFMSHMFVEAWGEEWLRRGKMVERQRRPVYEGQDLTAVGSPIASTPDGLTVDVVLSNAEGEQVALSSGEFPSRAPAVPDVSFFPFRPHLEVAPAIGSGGVVPGDIYRSTPFVYTDEIHDEYLQRVRETLPIYVRDRVVHPGYIVKLTMHDAVSSYTRSTPGVHTAVTVQHFEIAHVGETLWSSGHVTGVFEKKGNKYMESDQLVYAGQRPIALVHRTSIYMLATSH